MNKIERNFQVKETARKNIFDSLVNAVKQGEVELDFRNYDDPFLMHPVEAEFKGVKFISFQEQSSGVRLEAFWEEEEGERQGIHFGCCDAVRFRQIAAELSKKDPVLKSIRRKERVKFRRLGLEAMKRQRRELAAVKQVARLLKP